MSRGRHWSVFALPALLAACQIVVSVEPAAAAASSTAVRQDFVAAMHRLRLQLPEPADSARLRRYVIYDYLVAARLRRALLAAPADELDSKIDAFLQSHASDPVARNLRSDWLASLAARRRWDWFLPRAADVTSPTLVCDRLAGQLATGATSGLALDALARWSLPQKQPPECDEVFNWLHDQGVLTPELWQTRTRAALAANNPRLAREFASALPADRAAPLLQWAQLLDNPRSPLRSLAANVDLPVEADALEAGYNRLTRNDSAEARALLPALLNRPDVTPAGKLRLQRAAALGAAYGRETEAMNEFAALTVGPEDTDLQEWRVRSALWAGDFRQALTWIEQMPESLATQPRWKYWRARAVDETSGSEASAPLFAEIATLRDFYGYLAADRLHRDYTLNAKPTADNVGMQQALEAKPGVVRARELFLCDLTDDAQVEWAVAMNHAQPPVLIQAAHLTARWGWYSQSITSLGQAGELDDLRLRYPQPFLAEIKAASQRTGVPVDWILAVMRQESLFRTDAVSRAGARGLMQMMPATAAAVARRWHLPEPEPADTLGGLFDPTRDTALGAARLRELLDRYGGQLALSLAAYNAGAIPVARWLPPRTVDADVWIENIPYGETRSYVQRILEHIVAYAWVSRTPPPRLTQILPSVEPTVATSHSHGDE